MTLPENLNLSRGLSIVRELVNISRNLLWCMIKEGKCAAERVVQMPRIVIIMVIHYHLVDFSDLFLNNWTDMYCLIKS